MSYDIGIEVDGHYIDADGLPTLEDFAGEQHGNHTSNAVRSYRAALPDGKGLPDLNGLPCPEAAELLAVGVKHMEEHPNEHRALAPANGWGTYESALNYLRFALALCRAFPSARFSVSA